MNQLRTYISQSNGAVEEVTFNYWPCECGADEQPGEIFADKGGRYFRCHDCGAKVRLAETVGA